MNSGCGNAATSPSEWEQWLKEHAPKFLLFARQQSRFEADAQDLVQEAVVEPKKRLTAHDKDGKLLFDDLIY